MLNKYLFEIVLMFWNMYKGLKKALIPKPIIKVEKRRQILMSEESKFLPKVLDDLLNKQYKASEYHICNSIEDESEAYKFYNSAISHLESKLGFATYKGLGGGHPDCEAVCPSQIEINDFKSAIKMAWWKINNDLFYVLLTSHDADTLLCLRVIYSNEI